MTKSSTSRIRHRSRQGSSRGQKNSTIPARRTASRPPIRSRSTPTCWHSSSRESRSGRTTGAQESTSHIHRCIQSQCAVHLTLVRRAGDYRKESRMKIVVIGGTGLIGSKTVAILRQVGRAVLAGSPNRGINSLTGEGLKEAMDGAQVGIDLTNPRFFADRAVLEFFATSGRHLLPAEAAAGVRHHVAL